jgi:hypothetical protein
MKVNENLITDENHHILPKAKRFFPEYKSLIDYPWNKASLTYRQHYIAHIMLMKAFPKSWEMALSVIKTSNQHHNKNKSFVSSKVVEEAKTLASNNRKGIFSGGYNADGSANVSVETKNILSQIKTDFYSNPENRIKHSIACTGIKRPKTDSFQKAAQNRTSLHQDNLTKSIKKTWMKKMDNGYQVIGKGLFITPFGNFTNIISTLRRLCNNPNKAITIHQTKKNPWLPNEVIGKTPRQLGFFFVEKTSPLFVEYNHGLNQVHLLAPNHALESTLNDSLLHGTLHPQR